MSGAGNHNNASSRVIRGPRGSHGAPGARACSEAPELLSRQVPGAVYVDEEFPALTRTGGSSVRTKHVEHVVVSGKMHSAMSSGFGEGDPAVTQASYSGGNTLAQNAGLDSAGVSASGAPPEGSARVRSAFSQSAPQLSAFYAPASYMTAMGEMTAGVPPHHEPAAMPFGIQMGEQFSQPIGAVPLLNGMGTGGHRARRMRNAPRAGTGAAAAHIGEELATCTLQIELKRFYFDLRANERGPFLKIAEAEAKGTRSKIIIPAYGLAQFKSILDNMVAEAKKEYQPEQRVDTGNLAAPVAPETSETPVQPSSDAPSEADGDGQRGSELSSEDNDGSLSTPQKERDAVLAALGAEAVASGTPQSAVIAGQLVEIPATGLPTTLASETMRIETKKYYFDLLSNAKGRYLKISQSAGGNKRSSIVVPATGLAAFRDSVHEMCRYAEMSLQLAANPNMMHFAPGTAPAIAYPMFAPTAAPPGMPSGLYPSMGPPPPPAAPTQPAPAAATVSNTPVADAAGPTPAEDLVAMGHATTASAASDATATPVDVNVALTNVPASLVHGPVQIPIDEQHSIHLQLIHSEENEASQSRTTHLEITDTKRQQIRLPLNSLAALHAVLGDLLQATATHHL